MVEEILSGEYITFVQDGGTPVTIVHNGGVFVRVTSFGGKQVTCVQSGGTPISVDIEAELPDDVKEEIGY